MKRCLQSINQLSEVPDIICKSCFLTTLLNPLYTENNFNKLMSRLQFLYKDTTLELQQCRHDLLDQQILLSAQKYFIITAKHSNYN